MLMVPSQYPLQFILSKFVFSLLISSPLLMSLLFTKTQVFFFFPLKKRGNQKSVILGGGGVHMVIEIGITGVGGTVDCTTFNITPKLTL